jgi:hypothetical protein
MRRSTRSSASLRATGVAVSAATLLAGYWFTIRPWHLRWGASDADLSRRWPGDELVPNPRARAVRAVTIDAPPDDLWRWIMQVGRDRGGFYSYTWLENLIGADIRNVHHLIPELPERRPGDTVWMGPEHRFGGQARMVVGAIVPKRAMVLVAPQDAESALAGGPAPEGVWSFVIDPVSDVESRLVMLSVSGEPVRFSRLSQLVFWEPAHFVMERRMMLTIKRLAERAAARPPRGTVSPIRP